MVDHVPWEMPVNDRWLGLVYGIADSGSFEAAADRTLTMVLEVARQALSQRAAGPQGSRHGIHVVRGMVHIRPEDEYRRIATRHLDGGLAPEQCAPSATAWEWISETGSAVAIDVSLGLVEAHDGTSFRTVMEPPDESTWETRKRLLGRDATHVLALPLRRPGGSVEGMISIEIAARALLGETLWTADDLRVLRGIAEMTGPFLLSLPTTKRAPVETDALLPVVGSAMRSTLELLRTFAAQEDTVLFTGPTGAGKSRLARWCHEASNRRKGPFQVVDLSSVPEQLQMAELFGWKRGGHTGADRDNPGHIGRAERGSLFIDEIDKLSVQAQAGLLRVLEERKYRPHGDTAGDRTADVRFFVGTNARLKDLVTQGAFRKDLYFRIHVLPVRVMPLSERRDEIIPWATFMLNRKAAEVGAASTGRLAPQAGRALYGASWEGNLRQLDNVVRRAYALAEAERGQGLDELVIEARHVERALAFESEEGERPLIELLHAAATTFVLEAERARAAGGCLDLDLTQALRGLTLAAAEQRLKSTEEAFRLFGKEAMVAQRNTTRALRKELARVTDLYEALGAGPSPFGAGRADEGSGER